MQKKKIEKRKADLLHARSAIDEELKKLEEASERIEIMPKESKEAKYKKS